MAQFSSNLLEKIEIDARERYVFEHERSDKIGERITITLNVIFFAFAGIAYFFQLLLDFIQYGGLIALIMLAFLAISVICFMTAFIYMGRLFFGFKNGYIPLPKESKDYIEKLLTYYDDPAFVSVSAGEKEKLIGADISNYLIDKYEEATANNFQTNNTKSYYILRTNQWLVATIVCLLVVGVLNSVKHMNPNNFTNVFSANKFMEDKMSAKNEDKPPVSPPPKSAPPAKPVPPPVQYIKENANVPPVKVTTTADKKN